MGLRDLLHLKLKAFRLKRFFLGNGRKRRGNGSRSKASWMNSISHGYHVVEHHLLRADADEWDGSDSVVVQREQIEQTESWYFGIFDSMFEGNKVTEYMQSHFFAKNFKQSHSRRKGKETLKRAYLAARSKMREANKSEEKCKMGSASAMVINGEKLVIANMGDYRVVVCRDGVAHHRASKHHHSVKRHWSHGLSSGRRHSKGSDLVVGTERVDADTEFLILASNGIWEVMKNQEAVNLIRHLEDPQEAAECLAREALIRMSKSKISCIVIRFD